MADNDPLGSILGMLGNLGQANPLSAISTSVGQFQKGVTQFLDSVSNFNATLEELNGVARRLNSMLDTLEAPVQAFVPQVTRTIKTADSLVGVLEEIARRLGPLTQVAESAGSLFGFRPRQFFGGGAADEPSAPRPKGSGPTKGPRTGGNATPRTKNTGARPNTGKQGAAKKAAPRSAKG